MPRITSGIALVMLLSIVGCGDGDGGLISTTTTTTTVAVVEFSCPEPIKVEDAADVVAALGFDWRGSGAYSTGGVTMTPDLQVTGTVVIDAADLPVPQWCLERSDCYHGASFAPVAGTSGASVEGTAGPDFQPGAARLILTDTTVRLHPVLRDTHPGPFNYVPVVSVTASCEADCLEGSQRCPTDGICYALGDIYCRRCEGRSAAECACRLPEGTVEDGESCDYPISGDVFCTGECRDGVCVSEGC